MAQRPTALTLHTTAAPIAFTPSPALLHWVEQALPFTTPFEASISTAICANPKQLLPALSRLSLYGGVSVEVPLETPFTGPQISSETPLNLTLRYFERGRLVDARTRTIVTGNILPLTRTMSPLVIGLTLLVTAFGAVILILRGPKAPVPRSSSN